MIKCPTDECVGCAGCSYVCPTGAIVMKENYEGFQYPIVITKKCINCNQCNEVCPALNSNMLIDNPDCYAVQLLNKENLKNCASGGAFFGIAAHIIRNGGAVFGVMDQGRELEYIKIEKEEELVLISKSKYYQCEIDNAVFEEIKESSKEKKVLLSGTPCMIASFKKQMSFNQDNIITFEIICQGVPSKLVIDKFYSEKESKKQSKIASHDFRSKDRFVGRNYLNKYVYQSGAEDYYVGEKDALSLSFQRQIFLRESCYKCKFAQERRIADFTGGDLWNKSILKKIDFKLGCSVLLCNTEISHKIIDECYLLNKERINVKDALSDNLPFHKSVDRPRCRNYSYKLLRSRVNPSSVTIICCTKYYIKQLLSGKKR